MFEVSYLQFHQSVVKRPRAHIGVRTERQNKNARASPRAFVGLSLTYLTLLVTPRAVRGVVTVDIRNPTFVRDV